MINQNIKKYKYLIIGSGPTGLGAALRLKELGEKDFLILEKEDRIGGLATSYVDEKGFTWDVGGHVQFSHYKYFDELMIKALGEDGWLEHERESWVWMKGRFVPYPFQNNIRHLPKDIMWDCLKGIIEANKTQAATAGHFGDWIHATFGEGIAKHFMLPYNFKVWAYPPEEMSYEWIGERVAVTDLERVTRNIIFEKDDVSWGPNNMFRFPKFGGTGAIWESVGKKLLGEPFIKTNSEVVSIHADEKIVELKDGTKLGYEYLMSSMPLDLLVHLTQSCGEKEHEHASLLRYSNTNIVGVGIKGKTPEHLKSKCWMYFPESNSPYYRVTVFSNYSPNNVPVPGEYWSLMTETSESVNKPVDHKKLSAQTIDALKQDKLIRSADDIASIFQIRFNHGYPTPSLHRNKALDYLIPWFEEKNIYSRGRFGAWKYEVSNQDHSLMQGVEWANRMLHGIPEVSLPFPSVANAMWGK
jgi:protoporphyrinogen oxidase